MTERLDEYPHQLETPDDGYPWEPGYAPVLLNPFSNMRSFGKPLVSLTSPQLLAVRGECERRNGEHGTYFLPLMAKMDEILTERGGE